MGSPASRGGRALAFTIKAFDFGDSGQASGLGFRDVGLGVRVWRLGFRDEGSDLISG